MTRTCASVLVISCMVSAVAGAGTAQEAGQIVYKTGPGSGVAPPRVVREVKPTYPADAMRAGVQGLVELEFVVLPDGSVGEVKVIRSLRESLDQEAITAVKQWRFTPGAKDGEPVPVQVTAELTFTLRDDSRPPVVVVKPGQVSTRPRTTRQVKPLYMTAAKEAGIQGIVVLDAVVEPDGTVGDIRVTDSLDPGLDQEAVKAVKQWLFRPGTRDGKPVPVRVEILLAFGLK